MTYPLFSTVAGLCLLLLVMTPAYAGPPKPKTMTVTASAYNSVATQTTARKPSLAAWGDILRPGMRAIAVSRDLVKRGLTHGAHVRIEGLPGVYVVLDKMGRRFKNKIDIFMGRNVAAARSWGVHKDVRITVVDR